LDFSPGLDFMQNLTPATIDAYLTDRGIVAQRTTLLAGGVSGNVFRVETSEGRFVVKQACPQLRTRDAWFSDVARIFREVDVLNALADVLPESTTPRVLWVDRDNFAFAMTHAPDGPGTWKDLLLAGSVEVACAAEAGRVLGRIHADSSRHAERYAAFDDGTVFRQLRVDPFYRTVAQRCPDVADKIEPLIRDLLERRVALCHGDFTPKNMLVHAQGFTLVDFETATFGEPAFDIGLFLAHLVLKAIHQPHCRRAFYEAIAAFRAAYRLEIPAADIEDREARGLRHLGACLLARTDGTSPATYLTATDQNAARSLARVLLSGGGFEDLCRVDDR
jgi:5-methylthioribose kinase